MKKLFSIVLVLTMVFAIAGCNSTATPTSSTTSKAPSTSSIDYPKGTIKILVPYAAGGSTDLMARIIAPELSKKLGQSVIAENKPGGGGAIGMVELAKAKPDGYTIGITALGPAILTPNNSDVGYTNKEFAPISHISSLPSLIYVLKDSGIKTLDELVKKAEANYGKLTYSTAGAGLTGHIACEMFQEKLGKPGLFTMIPFDSGTEATTAVLGKQVDFSFGDAGDVSDYVKQGTIVVLAAASEERDPMFPDVPTFKELGYDLVTGPWWGFAAPAGTSDEIIKLLDEKIKECIESPEVGEKFNKLNQPILYRNNTDFTTKWMKEYDDNKRILEGLKAAKK